MNKIQRILLCVLSLSLWLANPAVAALHAELDRDQASENQTFGLRIWTDSSQDAEPDLSLLDKDFQIVGNTKSEQVSIINGQTSRHYEWNVTLLARHKGSITFPKEFTDPSNNNHPIAIRIVANESAPANADKALEDVYFETTANPREAYINSQILYTIKLYYAVGVANASINEPTVDNGTLTRLDKENRYSEVVHNRRYQVTEWRYLVVPQKSGAFVIHPPSLLGVVTNDNIQGFDPFLSGTGRPLRVQGKEMSLNILPIANNIAPDKWLPAQSLSIKDSWSDTASLRVGEPITRTITVMAQGLKGTQIPAVTIPSNDAYKAYPDQPQVRDRIENNTLVGFRTQKFVIIPQQSGPLTFPSVSISWFNTATREVEKSTLPAKNFTVLASALNAQPNAQPADPAALTASTSEIPENIKNSLLLWQTSAGLFLLAWIATVCAWLLQIRKAHKQTKELASARHKSLKQILTQLKKACHAHDARLARQVLLAWGQAYWGEAQIQSVDDLCRRIRSPRFAEQVNVLLESLYAAEPKPWRGDSLFEAFIQALKQQKQSKNPTDSALPPLYSPG